jgi:ABC-2 type transport system permease protein
MEIIVTSVSPDEIMAGKISAIFAIGLTQMLAWAVVVAVGLVVARARFEELSTFRLDWSYVVLILVTFLPAYILITSLLAAIGSITTELRESSQLSTLVTLPTFVPAWFTPVLINNPNGVLSVILTMFPLTAPLTLSIRWAFTNIPLWQIVLSLGLLMASAIGSIFLAARTFRAGMLRYGQRLSWDEVRQAIGGQTS